MLARATVCPVLCWVSVGGAGSAGGVWDGDGTGSGGVVWDRVTSEWDRVRRGQTGSVTGRAGSADRVTQSPNHCSVFRPGRVTPVDPAVLRRVGQGPGTGSATLGDRGRGPG